MLFNSIDFAIFLPIVFILYWFVTNNNLRFQNLLVVISSFVFYGWWDWRFLLLMIGSASIDYFVGIALEYQEDAFKRKALVFCSLFINLGILAIFKYFNFFVDNFVRVFSVFGTHFNPVSLNVVLPVGISFYTFQALSYTIDVYRKKIEPTHNIINYFAFISFFPQLVAGPIERATNLLPQFYVRREFDYDKAVDGLKQMLWGLFKKIVIADNCAQWVDVIFTNSASHSGSTLLIGALLFAFQIYGDFSGYSDIAIGVAKLFGFRIMRNFAFPYFSRDIAEFWRRWHISLTTWFRDYLYIPLGGSKGGIGMKISNTFIVFLVSGFWHGANWTFIVWGALNALFFLPLLMTNKNRINLNIVAQGRILPTISDAAKILLTFTLTVFAWIFFRADSVTHAVAYLSGIFSSSFFTVPEILPVNTIVLIIVFVIIEWLGREHQYAISHLLRNRGKVYQYAFYYSIVIAIFYYMGEARQFIYFQF
jgi:D-alanyl-lipoteichoic acid acyltransferase DltB (MBOAT superfamily)